jgi:beta-glucanase (GH16 family)
MEFLSAQFDHTNNVYPLSLVVQSRQSKMAGYDATKTGTYRRVNLTFDPTLDFHEYRIDYLPGKVAFYADSQLLAVMQGDEMPTAGGHMILQHWSNGNPLWSGGPPKSDSIMIVRYVKAYFNSSNSDHLKGQSAACHNEGTTLKDICLIPDGTAGDAVSGGKFFFNTADATIKETGSSENNQSDRERGRATSFLAWGPVHSGFALAIVLFLLEA